MARDEHELLAQTPGPQLELTPLDPETAASQEIEHLRVALEDGNTRQRRKVAAQAARFWRKLPRHLQDRHVRLMSGPWNSHFLSGRLDAALISANRLSRLGKRWGQISLQAEGLLARGLITLARGNPGQATTDLELSKALFASTHVNLLDEIRSSLLLASAYRHAFDRASAGALLHRARKLCLEQEEVPLLSSVSQNLGIIHAETGNLQAAAESFEFVIRSSSVIASRKRRLRGSLGLAKTLIRRGDPERGEAIARECLGMARDLGLAREQALAHEYIGDASLQKDDMGRAIAHFSQVNKSIARSDATPELRIELHRKLGELWIASGNAHYATLHARKALQLTGGPGEDILALKRIALEADWLRGKGKEVVRPLEDHANQVEELGFGYEHLLTAHRLVTIADSVGDTNLAAAWWARTEFLAESCSARPLFQRWKQERENEGQLPGIAGGIIAEESYTPTRLAEELPPVDLPTFGIITRSRCLQEQASWVARLAPTTVPILIRGESGTGKELFAQLAHALSNRSSHQLLALNCGAMPGELIESELFGHSRGSFTGAISDKQGLFRAAHRGTMFLDEIGEMPASAQTKLLRVLESGEFRPVGLVRPEKVDVRIVAATNLDLEKAVAKGNFRKDLYFRLKGLEVHLPPLRERLADVPVLAEYFLDLVNRQLGKRLTLPFTTIQWMMGQAWMGNVRELRLAVERAAALGPESGNLEEYHFATAGEDHGLSLPEELLEIERARMRNALEATAWNVSMAADLLGMSRTTLSGRLKKLEISRPTRD